MEDESYKKTNSYRIKTGVAGGVAGCMAKTAIAPMDRVKILFQTSHSDYIKYQNENFGFWRALKHIYNVHSIQGLFKGHSATLVRVFPYAGIKFAAYEQFKVYLKPNNPKNQGIFTLISASMAGIVAVLCTYPIELIRIKSAFETEKRLKAVVVEIFNEHPNGQRSKIAGLTGFYKGILPTIIGIIPYAGVSFYSYENLKIAMSNFQYTRNETSVQKLKPTGILICGAISGAVAQTFSYPIEVVRRNMQVGRMRGITMEWSNLIDTAKTIYRGRGGVKGFFAGLGIGYMKVAPMHAVSFYSYEILKQLFTID